ncbi:MAG: hypothetical protein U1E62_18760 [Alsobacter sp.]
MTRLRDALGTGAKLLSFHAARLLPTDAVSALGGAVVRWSVPRNRPAIVEGARRNLRALRPDLHDREVDDLVLRFLDNVGRIMAEFAVLDRILPEGRVTVSPDYDRLIRGLDGPAIALGLHTGNWEIGAALARPGVALASLSIEPDHPGERLIASRVRASLGLEVFPTSLRGLRDARAWLADTSGPRMLAIFGDETRQLRLMAPLFGRPVNLKGNLALVAKLSRRCRAPIFLYHVERTRGCRFVLHVSPLVHLAEGGCLPEDVGVLNALIEPVIRARLEQWHFLDNPY